jgi:transposase-like protein
VRAPTSSETVKKIIADLVAGGLKKQEIAEKNGVHISTIFKIQKQFHLAGPKTKTDPREVEAFKLKEQGMSNRHGKTHRIISAIGKNGKPVNPQTSKLQAKVDALKAKGLGLAEISNKLGESRSRINYYFYRELHRQNKANRSVSNSNQGASANGHTQLDKNFLIGYGCAELDRTLSAVAQRLGIHAHLLRSGFSKFLGSTAVRS